MDLAKKHLDAGFFCTEIDSDREFWSSTIGLLFKGTIELGDKLVSSPTTQYRYDANGSIIKVNHFQGTLPYDSNQSSGYKGVIVASGKDNSATYDTLSGELIRIVPKGFDDIVGIGISMTSPDPERLIEFYVQIMEFERISTHKVKAGNTMIFVNEGTGGSQTSTFAGTGLRYITVHVLNADNELKGIKDRGGIIAMDPIAYDDIARLGFVTDPDGNWIEVAHVNR